MHMNDVRVGVIDRRADIGHDATIEPMSKEVDSVADFQPQRARRIDGIR